jgi:hypothetical protein
MNFVEELLAIARRYRDEWACMASGSDDVAHLREVEKTIAAAEAAGGILPGNEDTAESHRIGTSSGTRAPRGGRGAEGSGGNGDGAV